MSDIEKEINTKGKISNGMKKIIIESTRIILMAAIFSLGLGIAFAWTGPTATPPNGNLASPINAGSVAQVKQGNLWLSGLNASNVPYTNGLIVQNGNVGIGTITPTAKLTIGGTAGVDGIKFPDGTTQTTAAIVVPPSSPVGSVVAYGATTPPSGWLIANGAAVSRMTYADLFSVIGTSFGTGNGSNTFNLPDLRGEFIRGWNNSSGNDPDSASRTSINGGSTGDRIGSYQGDIFKSHQHTYVAVVSVGGSHGGGQSSLYQGSGGVTSGNLTNISGGSETRPKNVYLMYIIKY